MREPAGAERAQRSLPAGCIHHRLALAALSLLPWHGRHSTMAEQDLLYMSAQRAAALVRRRKLSPVELVEAVLAQIERIAPLNAFVTVLPEQARAAARAAEQAVMRGDALPPLHGVPVHVKDQVDIAGIRTTFGSAIFADNVPTRDD